MSSSTLPSPQMDRLESWRLRMVLPHVRGRVLDIGCGYNNLLRAYAGWGVGVDVYPWPGTDVQVGDAARLPFAAASFDTVTILAALNHIPNRRDALRDIHRILRPDGQLILTMIGPFTGLIAHILFRHDEDVRGGFTPGELKGMRRGLVRSLLRENGYRLAREIPFQWGLNRVYIAQKGTADFTDDSTKKRSRRDAEAQSYQSKFRANS